MKLTLFISLFLVTPVLAGQHEDIVDKAFEAFDDRNSETWTYTETSERKGSVVVANHDPRGGENNHWELVSVDGHAPTEDELENFLSDKEGHYDDDQEEEDGAESIVQPGSLKLLEETEGYWLFSFKPSEDDEDEAFMEHIDGTMKIVKVGHYVEYMDLHNQAPFKPMTGVKIKQFRTRLVFAPAISNGPIVPKSVDVRVEGRAFLAIKIDESESTRYENYKYVGDQ